MAALNPYLRMIFALLLLLYCGYLALLYSFLDSYDIPDIRAPGGSRILRDLRPVTKSYSRTCQERHNLVYVKMIKCASETLTSIFRRFGYERDLNFVLPVGTKIYLGWPYPLGDSYYRPLKGQEEFNIMCEHVVYDNLTFHELMPPDSVYLTSLREPFSQFKSMFNYYNLKNIAGVSDEDDPITEYLHHLDKYEAKYKSPDADKRYCIPTGFTMSKNLMSFNLGFPTGSFDGTPDLTSDEELVAEWLSHLDETFHLVLIAEYLPESLVLLKRLMCWQMEDILHIARNVGQYPYKKIINKENVEIYRDWSRLDYVLYDHFNKTLWKKISAEGSDFTGEVTLFKGLLKDLATFCEGSARKSLVVPNSPWNSAFTLTGEYCGMLEKGLLKELQQRYDKLYQDMTPLKLDKNFC